MQTRAQAAQQLCIIMRIENMTVKFIFVWSTGRSGERTNERGKKDSNEWGEKCTEDNRFGGKAAYTFLCHKFQMNLRTLGISTILIKMFDLYSFFISFAPQLFPFCPLISAF